MSGAMSPALAQAASAIALQAEADAAGLSVGRLIQRKAQEKAARKPGERLSLPGRTWAAMNVRTRRVLVMLAGQDDEDPRNAARKPWESLTDAERAAFAACARTLHRDLASAWALF